MQKGFSTNHLTNDKISSKMSQHFHIYFPTAYNIDVNHTEMNLSKPLISESRKSIYLISEEITLNLLTLFRTCHNFTRKKKKTPHKVFLEYARSMLTILSMLTPFSNDYA